MVLFVVPIMSTIKDNATNSINQTNVMSIERRLELLEPRFTTPSNGLVGSPPGFPEPAPFEGRTVDRNTSRDGGAVRQDSPLSMTSKHSSNGSNTNHSHHSFTFATPMSKDTTVNNSDDGNLSTASNLPSSSVRSRRRPSLNSSFHAVSMAASKHIRRVAASSSVQQQHNSGSNSSGSVNANTLQGSLLLMNDANRSMSGLPSSSNSRASSRSASNQTLLTSHVQGSNRGTFQQRLHQQGNRSLQQQQRVVVESPPVSVTPQPHPPTAAAATTSASPAAAATKPSAARSLPIASSGGAPPANNAASVRGI